MAFICEFFLNSHCFSTHTTKLTHNTPLHANRAHTSRKKGVMNPQKKKCNRFCGFFVFFLRVWCVVFQCVGVLVHTHTHVPVTQNRIYLMKTSKIHTQNIIYHHPPRPPHHCLHLTQPLYHCHHHHLHTTNEQQHVL